MTLDETRNAAPKDQPAVVNSPTLPAFINLMTRCMKMSTIDTITVFLAEFLGTGLLVFLGCMGGISGFSDEKTTHFSAAFAFGLVVMIAVQSFGCVSGAHINPAVTIGAIIYKLVTIPVGLLYMVAQILGGIAGYGLLKLITPNNFIDVGHGHCVTVPHADITSGQAFAVEFLATAVLMFVCCGVWDPRNAKHHDSIPLRFGFTVMALALIVGPYTGCSMNPARTFGPALWQNNYTQQWIYWIGPLAAAAIVPFLYKNVFWREAPQEKLSHQPEELRLTETKHSV